jgi:hypothetical protein
VIGQWLKVMTPDKKGHLGIIFDIDPIGVLRQNENFPKKNEIFPHRKFIFSQ